MVNDEVVRLNSYVILQREGFFSVNLMTGDLKGTIGKDTVHLASIVGKRYFTIFKMIPIPGKRREFTLEECSTVQNISAEIMRSVGYGTDNRNLTDDGSSQSLSRDDIEEMRESGSSNSEILGKIIENSKTFSQKTEYAQAKYIKKKEKKYSEYIIIRKPTIRLIADINFQKQSKMPGLRHDVLSQIYSAANIQSSGVYALFECGTQAVIGSLILNSLGEDGLVINLGLNTIKESLQKKGILAMNYTLEQLSRMIYVKPKDFFKRLSSYYHDRTNRSFPSGDHSGEDNGSVSGVSAVDSAASLFEKDSGVSNISQSGESFKSEDEVLLAPNKRKNADTESMASKKGKFETDMETAIDTVINRKLNAIIIAGLVDPRPLIKNLLPHLNPSCQLVVYCPFKEPLVSLYVDLKKMKNVVGIHLMESWLRNYQVLPDRTHPLNKMTTTGYFLYGTKVVL